MTVLVAVPTFISRRRTSPSSRLLYKVNEIILTGRLYCEFLSIERSSIHSINCFSGRMVVVIFLKVRKIKDLQ
jgi:hypothetical protein